MVELLVVIAIIAILMGLLLPVLTEAKARAKRVQCISNLHQDGIAFHLFAHDHDGKFPMLVSTNDGGTLEYVYNSYLIPNEFYFQYHHFQALSNALGVPVPLVCPTDTDRQIARDFEHFNNFNVSFFVGANADFNQPRSILAGDRNITNAFGPDGTIIRLADGTTVKWTEELHVFKGNILYSDGHVARLETHELTLAKYDSQQLIDLVLPTTKKPPQNRYEPPAHYEPPPDLPSPERHRRSRPVIAYSQSVSGGRTPQNNSRFPNLPNNNSSAPTPTTTITPPNPTTPAPPPPNPPIIIRKTNYITTAKPPVTNEEQSPVIILNMPPTPIPAQQTWWPVWLLIILLLLALLEYLRRRLKSEKEKVQKLNDSRRDQ